MGLPINDKYKETEISYLTKKISEMEAKIEEDYRPKEANGI